MFDPSKAEHVYIAIGYTNLRMGIVQQNYKLDAFSGGLFLFCGRKRDRIKGLYWDRDGYILLYKRLETGRYQWPRTENELKELTSQQFRWLMEGLNIYQEKAIQPVTKQFRY